MATAIEELTRQDVEARVADWQLRLDALFARVEAVAGRYQTLAAARLPIPPYVERITQMHQVPLPQLSKLVVTGPRGAMQLIPKALWVIASNGRLDLVTNDRAAIVADIADPGEPPDWAIYGVGLPKGARLDDAAIDGILSRLA